MNYIILDIETTWLSKYRHKITEIAAIKFDWKNILWEFQTLINPERNIPSEITKLTSEGGSLQNHKEQIRSL